MPTKPTTIPRLGVTTAGVITATAEAPDSTLADNGWDPGDKVPAQFLDFLFGCAGQWFQWVDSLETQAITWTAVQTFSARAVFSVGADGTGSGTNPAFKGTAANNASSAGVEGVGVGAAPGGRFSGPSTGAAIIASPTGSGTGLNADASGGTGKALTATGNTTVEAATITAGGDRRAMTVVAAGANGQGVQLDVSGGSHTGLWIVGNATRAPLLLAVQAADPSSPSDGMVWINSTAGKVRARVGGLTVDLN